MIKAEQKPIEQILELVSPYNKILIAGCGGCVTVCLSGGEKEVKVLADTISAARAKEGKPIEILTYVNTRQCEPEFLHPMRELVDQVEVVLSLACGVGVQTIAEVFPEKIVLPGLNTKFMGTTVEQGVWMERCAGCGDCILHITGGVCPIARCSKSLMNGPCGGSSGGRCEVNPDIPCAWQLIYDRLKKIGKLEQIYEPLPPKSWRTAWYGGPRKMVREDLKV